jgi:hypothetical protein
MWLKVGVLGSFCFGLDWFLFFALSNQIHPPPSEWRNLATHCGQADMLQFLQHVDGCIFREIVAQDSLYVRI